MWRILLSQSRRFGLFALGMSIFTTALLMSYGTAWADMWHLGFFFLSLLGYLTMAAGLFAVQARQRGILEIAGFSALISTLVLYYLPYTGLFPSLFGLTIFFGVMTSCWFFLGTALSKKLGKDKVWRDSHAFLAPFPARRVWRHIVPGECEPSQHCTGTMKSFEVSPDDPTVMTVHFGKKKKYSATYELTFLEQKSPNICRFYFQGQEADGSLVDGVFALNITVMDRDSCFVSSTEERHGLSMGALIERWFDNPLHYQHVRLLDTLEDIYGNLHDLPTAARS